MIIEFNNQSLEQLLKDNNKVIIDLYATWCGPCQMLATQLEAFAKQHNDWTIIRVDSDKHNDVTSLYNLQAVPTMIIVVNNEFKEKIIGFKPLIEIEKITSKY